jgi:hypothetical protein
MQRAAAHRSAGLLTESSANPEGAQQWNTIGIGLKASCGANPSKAFHHRSTALRDRIALACYNPSRIFIQKAI